MFVLWALEIIETRTEQSHTYFSSFVVGISTISSSFSGF